MKVISVRERKSTIYRDYIIYETVEEVEKYKVKVALLEEAEVGDYVKTDNGFYLPLISVKRYPRESDPRHEVISYSFPRTRYNVIAYKPTGYISRNPLIYTTDANRYKSKKLTPKQRLVAEMMAKGVDAYQAYSIAYPNINTISLNSRLSELVADEDFLNYFLDKCKMNELIDSLENAGLNYEFLAKKLKERIEKNNDLVSLQFAFNVVKIATDAHLKKKKFENDDVTQIDTNLFEKLKESN